MKQRKYVAFDLEIYKIISGDFSKWRKHRPLRISCAATYSEPRNIRVWCSNTNMGLSADYMTKEDAVCLVEFLQNAVFNGATIITWNGLGFDFDVLAEESGMYEACRELALNHVDMMFHILCLKGFPLGLDKAAKGMKLRGKPAGMSGEQAPVLWQQGKRNEVISYVIQDTETTLHLGKAVEKAGYLNWISDSGKWQHLSFPEGWLTVKEALQLPFPDTSWMSKPLRRKDFTGWMNKTDNLWGSIKSVFTPSKDKNRNQNSSSTTSTKSPQYKEVSGKEKNCPKEIIPKHYFLPGDINTALELAEILDAISLEKQEEKYIANRLIREGAVDEINFLLSMAEEKDKIRRQILTRIQEEEEMEWIRDRLIPIRDCPCPICQGVPHLDPLLRYKDGLDRHYDPSDEYSDEEWGRDNDEHSNGGNFAGFIALDYLEDGDIDFFGLLE